MLAKWKITKEAYDSSDRPYCWTVYRRNWLRWKYKTMFWVEGEAENYVARSLDPPAYYDGDGRRL